MTIQEKISKELPNYINPSARKWLPKELVKTRVATQYIGEGAPNSSTDNYRKLYEKYELANTGEYYENDIVYVSSNGRRGNRVSPVLIGKLVGTYLLIRDAMNAGATIIMDTKAHLERTSGYNLGEMQLAEYLDGNGYYRVGESGVWKKVTN